MVGFRERFGLGHGVIPCHTFHTGRVGLHPDPGRGNGHNIGLGWGARFDF